MHQEMSKPPVKLSIPTDQIVPDILPKCKRPLFAYSACSLAVSFEPDKFCHTDHGYAVIGYSSQSQTVDRVLVNADAKEWDLLLNQRMGYVAVSRAREDALSFTNSIEQLSAALDRRVDKEMALEAVKHTQHQTQLDRNRLTYGGPLGYEQEPGEDLHSIERASEGASTDNLGSAEESRN